MAAQTAQPPILSQQLLLNVADQLKLPLQQIARQAELGQLQGNVPLGAIQTTADMALKLLDNYVLGVRLSLEPEQLQLEAVSVSSVLYDAAQQLHGIAQLYGIGLELDVAGRFGPVLANRQGLLSALVSLGTSLIEALPALETQQLKLQLATHRSRYGIVAGIYSDNERLTAATWESGRELHGRSRQPLLNLTHTSGAGFFVADSIMRAMQLRLRASRHHRLYGLGAVLQPNPQMQLV